MDRTVTDARLNVPLRNAKAELAAVQKLNLDPGECLDIARSLARLEPKQMGDYMGISHSLLLRGLKTGDLNFQRLWLLPDEYWAQLWMTVARKRPIGARVRISVEFPEVA